MRCRRTTRFLTWGLCIALVSGCATVRTLTKYQPGDPVLMSGTRLDVAAITHNKTVLGKLRAKPPAWPWLDLPFSFVADLFFWIVPRTPAPRSGTPGSE
jgi:uncharacterized protein YceK